MNRRRHHVQTPQGLVMIEPAPGRRVIVYLGERKIGEIRRTHEWTFDESPYGYPTLQDAVIGLMRRHAHRAYRTRHFNRRRPQREPQPWPAGLFTKHLQR